MWVRDPTSACFPAVLARALLLPAQTEQKLGLSKRFELDVTRSKLRQCMYSIEKRIIANVLRPKCVKVIRIWSTIFMAFKI